jgi:hypothetical protein
MTFRHLPLDIFNLFYNFRYYLELVPSKNSEEDWSRSKVQRACESLASFRHRALEIWLDGVSSLFTGTCRLLPWSR